MCIQNNWPTLFFGIFFIFCSSCSLAPQSPEAVKPAGPSIGEEFFLSEKYDNALDEYSSMYETALTPEDRSLALFGLACTQLTLAQSDKEVTEAITTFEKWQAENGASRPSVNSRMFVIALKTLAGRTHKINEENAQLLKKKNTIIANQKKKISRLGNTVDNIQKQLDQIEAIDATLQEKKKPL